jgi:hypothetical protein
MKSRIRFMAAALGVLLVLDVVSAQTTGPPPPTWTNEIRTPVSGSVFDPCIGEEIVFSGYVHTLVRFVQTPSPSQLYHITIVSNFQQVSGVGSQTGTTYQLSSSQSSTTTSSDGGTTVSTETIPMRLALNTAVITFRRHMTITPGGNTTVSYTIESVRCSP